MYLALISCHGSPGILLQTEFRPGKDQLEQEVSSLVGIDEFSVAMTETTPDSHVYAESIVEYSLDEVAQESGYSNVTVFQV